jgi:Heavy metal associated domain 2
MAHAQAKAMCLCNRSRAGEALHGHRAVAPRIVSTHVRESRIDARYGKGDEKMWRRRGGTRSLACTRRFRGVDRLCQEGITDGRREEATDDTPHPPRPQAEVASDLPGRLRVRFPSRSRHLLTDLQQALASEQGMQAVDVNHTTGSLTVTYDPQVHHRADIVGLLRDLNVLLATVLQAPQIDAPPAEKAQPPAPLTVADVLDDLDQRVAGLTGSPVHLRTLVPLSLVGLGAWRSWTQGLGFAMIPGWLWLGFDAFVKRHLLAPPRRAPETR